MLDVPRQRRSVGRSLGRHASRRIASHHIAGARPDGASRVAASRMDDAREARLALDACFSPTAIARTASSSASASDDAGAPTVAEEAAIVCVRVHDLFDACTDEAVMDVINDVLATGVPATAPVERVSYH